MKDESLLNPFVVQCGECKRVLADLFTLQTLNQNHLVHTDSTVPCGSTENGLLKDDSPFENCIGNDLHCVCGERVGMFLLSVTTEWNGCAGMYAFNKDKIVSYALGSTVLREKTLHEVADDVERLKCMMTTLFKMVKTNWK